MWFKRLISPAAQTPDEKDKVIRNKTDYQEYGAKNQEKHPFKLTGTLLLTFLS
jgi:hypothetical protein